MDISDMVLEGVKYMGIGIGVVFAVLSVFFVVIKLLLKIWPSKEVN
jgi:Na+-transporting methylmalonyl-CoA/oxaloacetate decarboxylase gamma subunit